VHALNRTLRRLSASLIFVTVAALGLPVAALASAPITGTVINRTTNKPSAGDEVTLLNLVAGMQEVGHGTTDAKGRFSLNSVDGGKYLVRVTHDTASYFQPVQDGASAVDVNVYDSGAKVAGVTTEVLVVRAQTDAGGANLEVTEDFVVKNASNPPMTQYSKEPFDVYLPAGAVVEASAAKSPDGVPTAQELTPLGEKGKYTIIFPIRPGETQIEVAYHLPYTGKLALNLKVAGLTEMLAVSLPKSMSFTPGADAKFVPVTGEAVANSQTYVARGLSAGEGAAFEIGGSGQLPRDTQGSEQGAQGQDQGPGAEQGQAAQDTAPGKGLGVPLDPNGTNEPFATKYKWWMLGALGLLLVAAAGVLLRKPTVAPVGAGAVASSLPVAASSPVAMDAWSVTSSVARAAGVGQAQQLQVLKDEIFALETERLQGRIGEAEYAQTKAAIELILRRALARNGAGGGPPAGTAV
jgi:hypothetical protein